jgi:hypothetical protein
MLRNLEQEGKRQRSSWQGICRSWSHPEEVQTLSTTTGRSKESRGLTAASPVEQAKEYAKIHAAYCMFIPSEQSHKIPNLAGTSTEFYKSWEACKYLWRTLRAF